MKIKLHNNAMFEVPIGRSFVTPFDKWPAAKMKQLCRFLPDGIEFIYYQGKGRCGIQYLSYKNLKGLHPYVDWYVSLRSVSNLRYFSLRAKIIE